MPPSFSPDRPSPLIPVIALALVALGAFSIDVYLPSLPSIAHFFKVPASQAQATISVFMVGIAIGTLLYGPLSDAFGRRRIVLIGSVLYCLASIICLLAPTIEILLMGRFLQAVAAACGSVIARAIVRDLYKGEQAEKIMSYLTMGIALVPALAPIVGGWLEEGFGWRASFLTMVLFGVSVFLFSWRSLPETNAYRDLAHIRLSQIVENYGFLLHSRFFVGHTLTVMLSFASIFSFITGSPYMLIEILGVSPGDFGYIYFIAPLGLMVGGLVNSYLAGRVAQNVTILMGLMIATAASIFLVVLIAVGLQTVAAVIAPMTVVSFGLALVLPNATLAAVTPFPKIAGSASALVGFGQLGMSGCAGFILGQVYNGTLLSVALLISFWSIAAPLCYVTIIHRSTDAVSASPPSARQD